MLVWIDHHEALVIHVAYEIVHFSTTGAKMAKNSLLSIVLEICHGFPDMNGIFMIILSYQENIISVWLNFNIFLFGVTTDLIVALLLPLI